MLSTSKPVGVRQKGVNMSKHVSAVKPIVVSKKSSCFKTQAMKEPFPFLKNVKYHSDLWQTVRTEQHFLKVIGGLKQKGHINDKLHNIWTDFYFNYKNAILSANLPTHTEELAVIIQSTIADNVLMQFKKPYTFPSYHSRILKPYNYFQFGQRYVASLLDFERSYLGAYDRWEKIQDLLLNGHNVVLLANHQTEADPGVFDHLIEPVFPDMSNRVTFVAGDRVVTDALCKPFSMGRNLFCVHSKKHMGDDPALKAAKMDTNRRTLVALQKRLNKGGCLLWIAPSGGRDRPQPDGSCAPERFDPLAVELFRNLISRAKAPGHLFPLAMYSLPMMPPPNTVDKAVGERRITNFTPIGMSVGDEIDWKAIVAAAGKSATKDEQHEILAVTARNAVAELYVELEKAVKDQTSRPKYFVRPWDLVAPGTYSGTK
uniref:Glycerol-3-phosphate acyltransferase, chloroplastic n=1 Tax=Polytomella parva TaxID=51329 RepID=A0A7S0YPF3_9CHLO|nr:glycerol-3-phosphate acyltransferase (GPAT) [Polytomella parva]